MRQVESGVDLVKNVHWRRLEPKEGHDEGEGDEGSLTTGKLSEGGLPNAAESDLDFETLRDLLPFKRLKLAEVAGEEFGEDVTEFAASRRESAKGNREGDEGERQTS
jgi:hypothetical protein